MPDRVEARRVLTAAQATALVGSDVPTLNPTVTAPTVAVDPDLGEPVYAYLPLDGVAELRRAVLGIKYNDLPRASGAANRSRNFGYAPRRPVYSREGCRPSGLASDEPAVERVLADWAGRLQKTLTEIDPGIAARDQNTMTAVDPSWKLGESDLWTSGVINQSSRLPYHRDRYNFPTWSAMPVLRRHMTGGYLHIPEYGAVIPCRDGWGVFFAGHALVHGVTPMKLARPDGYRYSVVYYALRGMKDCHTAAVETAYARKKRTERERDIARRLAAKDRSIPR